MQLFLFRRIIYTYMEPSKSIPPFRTSDPASHATAIIAQSLARNGVIPDPAVAAFLQDTGRQLAASANEPPTIEQYHAAQAEKDLKLKTLKQIEIASYLLANRDLTTQQVADRFGVLPSTIVRIVGTDGFQYILGQEAARLATTYKGMRSDFELQIQSAASLALERLVERIQAMNDTDKLLELVSKFAELMGMGAKQGVAVQVNNYGITGEHLLHASAAGPRAVRTISQEPASSAG